METLKGGSLLKKKIYKNLSTETDDSSIVFCLRIIIIIIIIIIAFEAIMSFPLNVCVHTQCSVMSNSLLTVNCSLSGSSVHRILQARPLEWVAISYSRGSS